MTSVSAAETLSVLRSNRGHRFGKNPRTRCCLLQKLSRSGLAMTVLPRVNRAGHSPPAFDGSHHCYQSLAEAHNIPAARAARTWLDNAPSLVDCAHSRGGVDEAN